MTCTANSSESRTISDSGDALNSDKEIVGRCLVEAPPSFFVEPLSNCQVFQNFCITCFRELAYLSTNRSPENTKNLTERSFVGHLPRTEFRIVERTRFRRQNDYRKPQNNRQIDLLSGFGPGMWSEQSTDPAPVLSLGANSILSARIYYFWCTLKVTTSSEGSLACLIYSF